MNSKSKIFLYRATRQTMALMLSLLLIPAACLDLYAQAPAGAYIPLNAVQLDQLVAPIALDPDAMVAQILTAATFPDQIGAADTWLNQNMNLSPADRAAGANAQPWDPSVKALIEYPAILDNLAKNTAWAAQLGNAYYNQPGDVMNAVQAMRLQAQQSNVLVSTPQQRVVVDAGVIDIVPVDPALVYVPYYNPWRVWGGLFTPYPGFYAMVPPVGLALGFGIGFGVGIGLGVFGGFGWGFHSWGAGWGGGGVLFGGRTYISNSTTVINHGNFGAHETGAFEHGGAGVPGGFHAAAHVGAARAAAARAGGAAPGAGAGRGGAPAARSAYASGAGRGAAAGARGGAAAASARGGAAAGARSGAAASAHSGAAAGARGGGAAASHPAGGGGAGRGGAPAAHSPAGGGHGGGAQAAHAPGGGGGHGGGAPAHAAGGGGHGGGAPAAHAGGGGHAAPAGGGKKK